MEESPVSQKSCRQRYAIARSRRHTYFLFIKRAQVKREPEGRQLELSLSLRTSTGRASGVPFLLLVLPAPLGEALGLNVRAAAFHARQRCQSGQGKVRTGSSLKHGCFGEKDEL
jgi:hypothetical protein